MSTLQPLAPLPPAGSGDLAARLLYMLLFAAVFWILCWTLAVTALAQLLWRLLNGEPSAEVTRFGAGLAAYAREIIEFLTFVSERVPYPFAPWPGGGSDAAGS